MWEISGNARRVITYAALLLAASNGTSFAVDTTVYQNNSQYGVSLPSVALPSGSDEVRAGDGTSCRSSVGGDGAYLDSGVIASPGGNGLEQSGSIYSRVVIPLGEKPRRLDCSALYDLEVQRLRMELQLARMGLQAHGQVTNSVVTDKMTNAASVKTTDEAWSTEGIAPTQAPKKSKKLKKLSHNVAVANVSPAADTQPTSSETPVESFY